MTPEMDTAFLQWLRGVTCEQLTPEMGAALEAGDDKALTRLLLIAFLADELEAAMMADDRFQSFPVVRADGSIEFLWGDRAT